MSILEKKLEACRVCGETDTAGKVGYHLNTVTCEACKKFYLRNIKNQEFERFTCARSGKCVITKQTRTSCAYCRFQKCIQVGMSQTEKKQDTVSFKDLSCAVCETAASGLHFGVISCEGCKGFFRRHEKDGVNFQCNANGRCEINQGSRNNCKYCRLAKCRQVGMDLNNMKIGRQSNLFKQQLKSTITNKSSDTLDQHSNNQNLPLKFNFSEQDNTLFSIQNSQLNNETKDLIKIILNAYSLFLSYKSNWISYNEMHEFYYAFEYLNSQSLKFTNYISCIPFFQEFQTPDLNKLIFHATIPLTVLESTKAANFMNIFDFDKEKYEAIKRNFPSFNSERFNSYIISLVENIKELKLDHVEYALYSVALILSNAANVDNDSLLHQLNTDVTRALIEYMQLRRNEYESSTNLIQLSGRFERINMNFQQEIYKRYGSLKLMGLNLDKYYNLIIFNRWSNQE